MSGAPTLGRVVVAGGAGAVGSLFAESLQDSGNDVVIVDRDIPGPAHRVTRFVRGDISDPGAPREVSRVTLGAGDVPHWIAISPDQQRVVITGYEGMQHRVVIARFDPATGRLAVDDRFREDGATEPGFRMDDKTWPHGGSAKGIPHGAVFSRP